MATLGGAEALGLAERIGSLEPGKDADMIAVDMRRIACTPVYDAHSALVYTGSGAAVTHAWVEGRALLSSAGCARWRPTNCTPRRSPGSTHRPTLRPRPAQSQHRSG